MVGFDLDTRRWSTTSSSGVVDLPELEGNLSTRDADLVSAASDFGHHVHRRPLAVLYPRSAADVAMIVRFGRSCGLEVTPRGQGHSVDGQAQIRDGIVVDLSTLAAIGQSGPDRISVDAGATWRAVLDASVPGGLAPPVLPDYLRLSVGGTLAAGGISGASHQHGCVADNVYDLDVVTSDGEFRSCSQTRHAELFDAVRGTQGQHGIITRASVALTPAPSAARSYQLRYHDLGTFLGDQGRLVHDRRFDHVLGRADYGEGAGWHFVLEALATFSPPEEPDDRLLLDGLGHARGTEQIDASSYLDFLYRLDPVEALLRSAGSWQNQPHPRCNVLLPGRHAETVISDVLDSLTPDDIGVGGSVLIYSIPTARLAAPHMPKARDALTVVFGLQRTAPLDDPQTLNRMRRANAELHARAGRLGGASYAYGPTHTSVRAPA